MEMRTVMLNEMTHSHPLRVYYEDTDLGGIVYYANYLKFIERGRTEWVRSLGVDQGRMRAEEGVVFAVRRMEAEFLRPARFGDDLVVRTGVRGVTGARIVLDQAVLRGEEVLFQAVVTLVALKADGGAGRLPEALRRVLRQGP
jgi:acyl-CoA thioester hydrolase